MSDVTRHGVYLFQLHLIAGGYAYFSTFTRWIRRGDDGGEVRKPMPDVDIDVASKLLETLGHYAFVVHTWSQYEHWLLRRGWAFVAKEFGQHSMSHWLESQECVQSALDTHTSRAICAPGVLRRQSRGEKRKIIADRDLNCCLLCGQTSDDAEMTIHHIRAQSRGGETASSNMVLLCHNCNHAIGTAHQSHLYHLAGIPHGYDPALIRAEHTHEAFLAALRLTDNLMHSRCEIW